MYCSVKCTVFDESDVGDISVCSGIGGSVEEEEERGSAGLENCGGMVARVYKRQPRGGYALTHVHTESHLARMRGKNPGV